MSRPARFALLALVTLSTVGCDRVTKHAAVALLADKPARSFLADSIRLQYAENTGGFLSFGAALPTGVRTTLFTVAVGLALLALLVALFRSRWPLWRGIAFALLFAGGISNWIDRVLRGSVVDFLNVGIGWLRTGIFNVADMAIMLGLALFVLSEWSARGRPSDSFERTQDE
jgi:signal peptidase II